MKSLINYLKKPLINTAEICRVCEINSGFMSDVLRGKRKLPEKHLWPIMKALCGLDGFILKGHTITFEDHVFIHSIPIEGVEARIEEMEDGKYFIYVPIYKGLITDGLEMADFLKSL